MLSRSLGIALGIASSVSAMPSTPVSRLVASLRCPEAVEHQLELWSVSGEVLRAPSGMDGAEVLRLPTHTIGVWATLRRAPSAPGEPGKPGKEEGDDAVLVLTRPGEATRVVLDEDCRPDATTLSLDFPPPDSGGYSDEELARELARDDRLVVFLWSPHMPLSAEGYAEIVAATSELGLPLVSLCDPSSDPAYVETTREQWDIPEQAARPLASVELLMRDLAVHTPAILVFSRGSVEPPLPGYRGRAAYREYLRSIFGPSR